MVTKAEGLKRLIRIAQKLERLPRSRFYFGTWVGGDWQGKPDLSCGTTACAMGWACTLPSFRKLGLKLDPWWREPVLNGNSHQSTIAKNLFGITSEEYSYLFTPIESGLSPLATPKQVARHIRNFVKEKRNEKP